MEDFGKFFQKLRKSKNLSQRELAARVDVDYSYISKIETGKQEPPSEELLIRIANVLNFNKYRLILKAGKVPTDFAKVILEDVRIQSEILYKLVGGDDDGPSA